METTYLSPVFIILFRNTQKLQSQKIAKQEGREIGRKLVKFARHPSKHREVKKRSAQKDFRCTQEGLEQDRRKYSLDKRGELKDIVC